MFENVVKVKKPLCHSVSVTSHTHPMSARMRTVCFLRHHLIHVSDLYIFCFNRHLIGCGKSLKIMWKLSGIIIMWKNMLIMLKTPWILRTFKQFIKLTIVPFQCFAVM